MKVQILSLDTMRFSAGTADDDTRGLRKHSSRQRITILFVLTEAGARDAAHVAEAANKVRLVVNAPRRSHAAVHISPHHIAVLL